MERATIQDPDLQAVCVSPTRREQRMDIGNSHSSHPSSNLLLMLLLIYPNWKSEAKERTKVALPTAKSS